jgi:hypothetical protein
MRSWIKLNKKTGTVSSGVKSGTMKNAIEIAKLANSIK